MIEPELWTRIEPILDHALELPEERREAYLREACGDDEVLLREVRRLLRASDRAHDSVLEETAAELAAPLLDAPGQVIVDRYELLELLGAGGMGTVFLARDRTLGRTVALKFLPPQVAADPEALHRFRNEARAASALDHPNIAVVHDIAEAKDGRPFIVMGYYAGETLRERIADGPLPVSDAVGMAREVAEGLSAAHAAGIIHRDIKPSNILMTEDGGVRILDFGIAKMADQTVTGPSATLGTVAYMSPEQTRPGEVDARTDLWSLGVVLYEALTCRRPFAAGENAATIHAIRNEEPQPLQRLRPEVSTDLRHILDRCLRKEPDRRFRDADSLVSALRDVAAARTGDVGDSTRRAALIARLRRPAALLGAVVLLGLLALGYLVLQEPRETPGARAIAERAASAAPVRIAVLPFGVLGDERFAYLEEGMVELFSTQLDGAGPLRTVDPGALLAFLRSDEAGESRPRAPVDGPVVARRFDADLFLAGSVVEAGGRLRIRATLYDAEGRLQAEASSDLGDESQLFELVDEVARQLIGSRYAGRRERLTRLAAATTSSVPALKAYLEGERAWRDGHFDDAVASFRGAVERDSSFALAWYRLAVAAEWNVRPAIAEEAAERAMELSTALPEHDRLLVTAWSAYASGDPTRAERVYRRILDSYPDDLEAWLQLGEVRFHYGPLEGRPLAGARGPFARALTLEPTNEGALLHLARIAAWEGAEAEVRHLVQRLITAHPGSEIAIEARALRAFATADEAAVRAVIREFQALDSDAIFTAIWTVAYTRDPTAVARLARLLTDENRPAEVRARGHLLLATSQLARGRARGAKRELAAAAELSPAWALELASLWTASSDIIAGTEIWRVDSLRAAIDRWDAAAIPSSLAPNAFLSAHDSAHPVLKTYLIAWLDLAEGEPETVTPAVAALERVKGPPAIESLASNLARGLRGEALGRAGRPAEALALLETGRAHSPYTLAVASPFHAGSLERFLQARLLAEVGRPEEALNFYTTMGAGSVYDLPYVAPAHLRAARLLESTDPPERAAEHYRRASELWRDADSDVMRYLEDVIAASNVETVRR